MVSWGAGTNICIPLFNLIFKIYLFILRERESMCMMRGKGAEREDEREGEREGERENPKQALHCSPMQGSNS